MSRLRRLARLQPAERAVLIRAACAVAFVRLVLWLLPFGSVRRMFGAAFQPDSSADAGALENAELLAWAVRTASRSIPAATCLTQSLALHWLLARAGCASQIHIGVAKDAETGFQAHAWVEHNGRPLLSGPSELDRYSRLVALDRVLQV